MTFLMQTALLALNYTNGTGFTRLQQIYARHYPRTAVSHNNAFGVQASAGSTPLWKPSPYSPWYMVLWRHDIASPNMFYMHYHIYDVFSEAVLRIVCFGLKWIQRLFSANEGAGAGLGRAIIFRPLDPTTRSQIVRIFCPRLIVPEYHLSRWAFSCPCPPSAVRTTFYTKHNGSLEDGSWGN